MANDEIESIGRIDAKQDINIAELKKKISIAEAYELHKRIKEWEEWSEDIKKQIADLRNEVEKQKLLCSCATNK